MLLALSLFALEPAIDPPGGRSGEAPPPPSLDSVRELPAGASLPLNRATATQLAEIEGVDDLQADAIVALREERGRLNSVEELRILPGMTDTALSALRTHTTIDIPMATGATKTYKTVDEVLAEFDGEPSIQEVQQMAMQYTHTHRDQVEKWLWASKNSAWLPELKLRYYYQDQFGQDFDYVDGGAIDLQQGDTDVRWQAYVEVRWRLDDLVMSTEWGAQTQWASIRVISETQDVVKLRDKVLSEVTRVYFDRRRLQVDMLLNPTKDLDGRVEIQLRLMELTAELDAYTGGAFSSAVARG